MATELPEVMSRMVATCPWFEDAWQEHRRQYGDDLPYVAAGEFACCLLQRFRADDVQALTAAAAAIEQSHLQGSPAVRELATTGFLESVQNVWASAGVDPEEFGRFLQPESRLWWDRLNRFWSGEATHVGP